MHVPRCVVLAAAAGMVAAVPAAGGAADGPATAAKSRIVRDIAAQDARYSVPYRRAATCTAVRVRVRTAASLRRTAVRGVSVRLTVAQLRTRRAAMWRAVVLIGTAAARCTAVPPAAGTAALPAPVPSAHAVPEPTPAPAPVPAPVVVPPAPPLPGPEVVLPSPTVEILIPSLPGVTAVTPLDLGQLLSGDGVDLGLLLGSEVDAGAVRVVAVDDLEAGRCGDGLVCVALHAEALRVAVGIALDPERAAGFVDDPEALAAEVAALAGAGRLDGLVEVREDADGRPRLVPIGPLAAAAAAPEIPDLPVGALLR